MRSDQINTWKLHRISGFEALTGSGSIIVPIWNTTATCHDTKSDRRRKAGWEYHNALNIHHHTGMHFDHRWQGSCRKMARYFLLHTLALLRGKPRRWWSYMTGRPTSSKPSIEPPPPALSPSEPLTPLLPMPTPTPARPPLTSPPLSIPTPCRHPHSTPTPAPTSYPASSPANHCPQRAGG